MISDRVSQVAYYKKLRSTVKIEMVKSNFKYPVNFNNKKMRFFAYIYIGGQMYNEGLETFISNMQI